MLHREYIPWIALNCREEGPKGPLDEPRFPEEQYGKAFPTEGYGNIREFWKESARKGCRAARDITELLYTCMKWQRLAETPLVMFAEYQSKIYGECWCAAIDRQRLYTDGLQAYMVSIFHGWTRRNIIRK